MEIEKPDEQAVPQKIESSHFKANQLQLISPSSYLHSKVAPTTTVSRNINDDSPTKDHLDSPVPIEKNNDIPLEETKELKIKMQQPSNDSELAPLKEAPIIKVENIHKTYLLGLEGIAALRGISLEVYRGEFVCLFGTSGGGKTTMLNIIGMIDKPTRGSVYIENVRIKNSTADTVLASIRLSQMGFVFQTFNLINSLTALENVELPMQLKGDLSRKEIRKSATKLLAEVGLGERINHFPRQLSGGEQQRVTIARAIANNPAILLLDEPTGDLDTKNTDVVMNILVELNKTKGMTMIMVTHDMNLKNFANRVFTFVDGKLSTTEKISEQARSEQIGNLKDSLEKQEGAKLKIREGIMDGTDHKATLECPMLTNTAEFTTIRKKDCYKFFSNRIPK